MQNMMHDKAKPSRDEPSFSLYSTSKKYRSIFNLLQKLQAKCESCVRKSIFLKVEGEKRIGTGRCEEWGAGEEMEI